MKRRQAEVRVKVNPVTNALSYVARVDGVERENNKLAVAVTMHLTADGQAAIVRTPNRYSVYRRADGQSALVAEIPKDEIDLWISSLATAETYSTALSAITATVLCGHAQPLVSALIDRYGHDLTVEQALAICEISSVSTTAELERVQTAMRSSREDTAIMRLRQLSRLERTLERIPATETETETATETETETETETA